MAMGSGSISTLKAALQHLSQIVNKPTATDATNTDNEILQEDNETNVDECHADEEQVMATYGKALRAVIEKRDTYSIKACDVCEQMSNKLCTLKSYENKKGFTSEKMTEIIELLYINKTQRESLDDFLENTFICSFCADKL